MPADHNFPTDRTTLTRLLFPAGVPILWSPTLVFYDEAGRIDRGHQLTHLAFMTPHVKGYLVPGSTGDAWEMDDAEALAALEVTIPYAVQHGLDLLVGVLRPTTGAMHALIDKVLTFAAALAHIRSPMPSRRVASAGSRSRHRLPTRRSRKTPSVRRSRQCLSLGCPSLFTSCLR